MNLQDTKRAFIEDCRGPNNLNPFGCWIGKQEQLTKRLSSMYIRELSIASMYWLKEAKNCLLHLTRDIVLSISLILQRSYWFFHKNLNIYHEAKTFIRLIKNCINVFKEKTGKISKLSKSNTEKAFVYLKGKWLNLLHIAISKEFFFLENENNYLIRETNMRRWRKARMKLLLAMIMWNNLIREMPILSFQSQVIELCSFFSCFFQASNNLP